MFYCSTYRCHQKTKLSRQDPVIILPDLVDKALAPPPPPLDDFYVKGLSATCVSTCIDQQL